MVSKIIERLENQEITIGMWAAGFVGTVFIRFFLEALSSPTYSGIIQSDSYTLIHYGLFYLAILLCLSSVVGHFGKNYVAAIKLALFGLPVIWLAPIIDLILSAGQGYMMGYLFETYSRLAYNFFTFFGPHPTYGITIGIRIEVAIILFAIGSYVWMKRKSVLQSVLAALCSYIVFFLFFAAPGIVCTVFGGPVETYTDVEGLRCVADIIAESNIVHNTLREGALSVPAFRFFELTFNKLMSQILLIAAAALGAWHLWNIDREKFTAIAKNSRLERIFFYLFLLFFGMGFAHFSGYSTFSFTLGNISGFICLVLAWIGMWMYAVHTNDVADVDIDKISNSQRPLVQNTMTSDGMLQTAHVWLGVSLASSWVAGFYPFFMNLVCLSAYYIYSSFPQRLKRVPILSSFLISIACLATVLAGFFFISEDKQLRIFPIAIAAGIMLIFTLGTNMRDMKDVEGDSAEGIKTLPVLFGRQGARVVGILLALSFLLVPLVFSSYILYIAALPAAVVGYKLITRKPYEEKRVFILFLIFAVAALFISFL